MTPKNFVKREYPSAWWNAQSRRIEGYSECLFLSDSFIHEKDAWKDAAKKLRKKEGK